jgi:hypothetical protein
MNHRDRLATAVLAALAVTQAAPLAAQPPEPPREGFYVGPASCAQDLCHGSTTPRRVFDVDQDEYYVWLHQDRHARAYEVLFEARSEAIARSLGLASTAPETPACVTCHALVVPEGRQSGGVELPDGVSCEACHGPASGWRGGHTAQDWTHERSVAAGMTDLSDLSVRAGVCQGCHLGGPGRVVDHDLIAAGHPRLQFELDNFSQAMPEHWRRDPAEGVRAWAVGQAVGLRDGAEELARRARGERWPDFSVLSCYACHHAIEERGEAGGRDATDVRDSAGGDRFSAGARAYRARIGLPPWSPARWAVLRVLVERHAPRELAPLDEAVGRLARQTSRLATPPAEVAASAEAVAARLAPVADRLRQVRWSPAEAREVALAITARRAAFAQADVHTGEQVVQALYSLGGYLLETRPGLDRGGLTAALDALADTVEDPAAFDRGRFRDALAAVAAEMR